MRLGLGHVAREYPHRPERRLDGDDDLRAPRLQHPVFFGSTGWTRCVEGWWTLLVLARGFPQLSEAGVVRDLAIATFTDANVAGEVETLQRDTRLPQPQGWGWLLMLHAEAERHRQTWSRALDPLASEVALRLGVWLAETREPVRSSGEANSALALLLAHGWALRRDPVLARGLEARAVLWYGDDRAAQVWEPDGEARLSPLLTEAHCLMRLWPAGEFEPWFEALLPELSSGQPAALLTPVEPRARDTARIAALNLSRAWSWRALGARLPLSHVAHAAAERHLAAGLRPVVDTGVEPWPASFALLALLPDSADIFA